MQISVTVDISPISETIMITCFKRLFMRWLGELRNQFSSLELIRESRNWNWHEINSTPRMSALCAWTSSARSGCLLLHCGCYWEIDEFYSLPATLPNKSLILCKLIRLEAGSGGITYWVRKRGTCRDCPHGWTWLGTIGWLVGDGIASRGRLWIAWFSFISTRMRYIYLCLLNRQWCW